MVEAYPNTIWDRKKWREERDKTSPKVPQGACKNVSVGDELDRFHNDFAKGLAKVGDAAQRLADKMGIYIKAVEKTNKKWTDRVKAQIQDKATGMVSDIKKIDEARDKFKKGVTISQKVWPKVRTEALLWLTTSGDKPFKDPSMDALMTALKEVDAQGVRLRYASDEVDKSITTDAHKFWYRVDGGKPVDLPWIEGVDALVKRLPTLH